MIGIFISAALVAIYWFGIRRIDGATTAHRLALMSWDFVIAPFALGCWLVYSMTGFSVWLFPVAYLAGMFIFAGWIKVSKFLGLGRGKSSSQVLRGTEIISEEAAIRWLKRSGDLEDCAFKIGGIPIPVAVENTGFLMAGATGTGKTLAFLQVLDSARDRAHKALVGDLGGEYVQRYYRAGKDVILNPFECRTADWSPFAEMRQSFDATRVAASMIPEGTGEAREWNGYARTVLEGIMERLYETGRATNESLVWYALGADSRELAELCAGTPAAVFFVSGNERQLGSIRGILASYIKPLTYLRPESGKDSFSIRKWVESDGDSWLFISFQKDQLEPLRRMLAAQIDCAIVALLSLSKDDTRRVWFSIDEFAQYGEIQQIEPLLNFGRQRGACTVLGIQSVVQPSMVYGQQRGSAILTGCSTWTVLKQNDADSADYMSRYLADEEIRREVSSSSTNKDSTSNSTSEQYVRQRAIMPGELMQLAKRRAIVNVSGPLPPAWTEIPLPKERSNAEPVDAIQVVDGFKPMLIQNPAAQLPAPGKKDDDEPPAIDYAAALR